MSKTGAQLNAGEIAGLFAVGALLLYRFGSSPASAATQLVAGVATVGTGLMVRALVNRCQIPDDDNSTPNSAKPR